MMSKDLERDVDKYVILHDVRSVFNVGSIFRTADAAAVKKIFLLGYTPGPLDRFGRVRKDFQKISLGAEKSVAYEHAAEVTALFQRLHEEGIEIVAVEQDARSIPCSSYKSKGAVAYVFGNEPDGLPKEILDQCDTIIEIPMRGTKESLNVSVTAGIALFNT